MPLSRDQQAEIDQARAGAQPTLRPVAPALPPAGRREVQACRNSIGMGGAATLDFFHAAG